MKPKHRSRAPFALGLDPAAYNPQGLKAYTEKELKTEYSRLRREANDRLRKLAKSEFRDSEAYIQNVGKFSTIKEIDQSRNPRRVLERLLIESQRFVMAKSSSASGQREIRRENIATLHAHGYTWVNTKNFREFTEFMEELRAKSQIDNFYTLWSRESTDLTPESGPATNRSAQRGMFEKWRRTGSLS